MAQSVACTSRPNMLQCLARKALYSSFTKPFPRVFLGVLADLRMYKRRAVSTKVDKVAEESAAAPRKQRKTSTVVSLKDVEEDEIDGDSPEPVQRKRGGRVKASAQPTADSDEDYDGKSKPSPKKSTVKGGRKGAKAAPKPSKKESDDEGAEGDSDGEDLVRSQTQYARWHQQPQHIPSRDKRGLKVVGWNVNGLRAILKKGGGVKGYVDAEDPDVLCLSETKIDASIVSQFSKLLPGYHASWACSEKKGYAGVALFSKVPPLSVSVGIDHSVHDNEGRVIAAEFERFIVVSSYIPNSGGKLERLDYRTKEWDVAMLEFLQKLRAKKPVILVGDLNVANEDIDLANPKGNRNKTPGFCDAERDGFKKMLAAGFRDVFRDQHPTLQQYSYWGVRHNAKASNKGWRVDYVLVTEDLAGKVQDSFIRASVEGSDHVPVGIDLVLLIATLTAKAKENKKRKHEEKKAKKAAKAAKKEQKAKKAAKARQEALATASTQDRDVPSASLSAVDLSISSNRCDVSKFVIVGPALVSSAEKHAARTKRFETESYVPQSVASDPLFFPVKRKKRVSVAQSDDTESFNPKTSKFLVGTCTDVEKSYFRITSEVNPSTVRPLHVLKSALGKVKRLRVDDDASAEYEYLCDQLKGIRQDLTLQGIRTEFTVDVYECHARMALEEGDLNEYNQCQTQLQSLYDDGLCGHHNEFAAYRLLYLMYMGFKPELCRALADVDSHRASGGASSDPAVLHAMQVVSAVNTGNYHSFFHLYPKTPNNGGYLLDYCIHKLRVERYERLVMAYAPTLPLEFVAAELGLVDGQLQRFLSQCKAVVHDGKLDTKGSRVAFAGANIPRE